MIHLACALSCAVVAAVVFVMMMPCSLHHDFSGSGINAAADRPAVIHIEVVAVDTKYLCLYRTAYTIYRYLPKQTKFLEEVAEIKQAQQHLNALQLYELETLYAYIHT